MAWPWSGCCSSPLVAMCAGSSLLTRPSGKWGSGHALMGPWGICAGNGFKTGARMPPLCVHLPMLIPALGPVPALHMSPSPGATDPPFLLSNLDGSLCWGLHTTTHRCPLYCLLVTLLYFTLHTAHSPRIRVLLESSQGCALITSNSRPWSLSQKKPTP